MNPAVELIIVTWTIACAAAYLARRFILPAKKKSGCGGGCCPAGLPTRARNEKPFRLPTPGRR